MGPRYRVLGVFVVLAVFLSPKAWSLPSLLDSCEEAMDAYQETYQAFQDLSRDCLSEAGIDPRVTLEGCPSVDHDLFRSLVSEMEKRHHEVCFLCDGWPSKALGEGSCEGR